MSLYRPRSIPSIYATGLVVGASLICYGNSLFNGFVFDDPAYINHPVIRQFLLAEAFLEPWRGLNLYRPLTLVSLAFDYLLYGEVPAGFHLTHILLHAANCLVLHRIALKLLDRPGAALLAGLFYALHPLQGDVVNWLSARGDLLMGLFLGLGFWCHLQARLSPAPSLWRWGAWALYGASLLAKETGIVLMGIVWCYDACQDAPRPPSPTALARFSLNWLKRTLGLRRGPAGSAGPEELRPSRGGGRAGRG